MTSSNSGFHELRMDAVQRFVQTMIIVDDREESIEVDKPTQAEQPSRVSRANGRNDNITSDERNLDSAHGLRAKEIIDHSLELGVICSIIRPGQQEYNKKEFLDKIGKASKVADIVCLDWEIHDDGGGTASRIIRDILTEDDKSDGRIRLIAIYTGSTSNTEIINKIYKAIPDVVRNKQNLQINNDNFLEIIGDAGVKIVCLFKKHGIQLSEPLNRNQLEESELPKRLQEEFAELSKGLLSNVALATIASIREVTHRILARFPGELDGPWLHHRVMIPNRQDSEEYAVNVVLSEIKGAIDIHNVGENYAGKNAVAKRVKEIANGSDLRLFYNNDKGSEESREVHPDKVIKCIDDGNFKAFSESIFGDDSDHKKCQRNFTSLFSCTDLQDTCLRMHRFASLTGVRNHPGKTPSPKWVPMLGLGTIIRKKYSADQEKKKEYFLCLQASCDSVRIEKSSNFVFVKLNGVGVTKANLSNPPEHVIPEYDVSKGKDVYIGMSIPPKESYRALKIIKFSSSSKTKVVKATSQSDCKLYTFTDSENIEYVWVADLKRRRALGVAQDLAKEMGRLGFDEFEPYRK